MLKYLFENISKLDVFCRYFRSRIDVRKYKSSRYITWITLITFKNWKNTLFIVEHFKKLYFALVTYAIFVNIRLIIIYYTSTIVTSVTLKVRIFIDWKYSYGINQIYFLEDFWRMIRSFKISCSLLTIVRNQQTSRFESVEKQNTTQIHNNI